VAAEILHKPVLVLNKCWQPIDTTTVFNAVCKVYCGKAQVVHSDYSVFDFDEWVDNWSDARNVARIVENRVIQTARLTLVAPEVIIHKYYTGYRQNQAKFSRRNLFERDKCTCQYCGLRLPSRDLTIDHVMPKSRGGQTDWTNVVVACVKCNTRKSNRTPAEAGMTLLAQPRQPHWSQTHSAIRGNTPKSWEDFLGSIYWDISLQD
jgi:5-methylcytosine-specific restriction endonuclease McrA